MPCPVLLLSGAVHADCVENTICRVFWSRETAPTFASRKRRFLNRLHADAEALTHLLND
jgi:hypothetical protein